MLVINSKTMTESLVKSFLFLFFFFMIACGSHGPRDMARTYCECFKRGQENPEIMEECTEIAKENQKMLGKDPDAARIYGEEIIKCVIYNQPE